MSIKMKRLEEVACVFDDRCAPVRGAQRLLRKGPYRLYVETGFIPFDDYAFDGTYLLLGSVCNVEAPDGCLRVVEAHGRFAATDLYHVIACECDEDIAYLRLILSRIPAHAHADVSGRRFACPRTASAISACLAGRRRASRVRAVHGGT